MTQTPAYYRYNPHIGSPRDPYHRVDYRTTRTHSPEQPGRFVAVVEGETVLNSMWGRRVIKWRAEPGTVCMIHGYWSDGTVHLRWPAFHRHYMMDGRFPAWVVEEDPDADIAGGGFLLRANELLPALDPVLSPRLFLVLVLLLAVIVAMLVPQSREAIQNALHVGL